jgi:hypothetical protein
MRKDHEESLKMDQLNPQIDIEAINAITNNNIEIR